MKGSRNTEGDLNKSVASADVGDAHATSLARVVIRLLDLDAGPMLEGRTIQSTTAWCGWRDAPARSGVVGPRRCTDTMFLSEGCKLSIVERGTRKDHHVRGWGRAIAPPHPDDVAGERRLGLAGRHSPGWLGNQETRKGAWFPSSPCGSEMQRPDAVEAVSFRLYVDGTVIVTAWVIEL